MINCYFKVNYHYAIYIKYTLHYKIVTSPHFLGLLLYNIYILYNNRILIPGIVTHFFVTVTCYIARIS